MSKSQSPIYIHYGATRFDPAMNFPITNSKDWRPKPEGGLWASRADASYGWVNWCEWEDFIRYSSRNFFQFTLQDDSKIYRIHSGKDLRNLPEDLSVKKFLASPFQYCIDFEACLKMGIDAIELCWFGDEFPHEKPEKPEDELYYALYGWDCDSIVVLNPDAVIPIAKKKEVA